MKIGIVGPIPAEMKSLIERAMMAGAQVEFLSSEEAERITSSAKPEKVVPRIPVASVEPPHYTSEINVPREKAVKDEVAASLMSPFVGKMVRGNLPYKGKIDISKYSDRDVLAAVLAMSRILESPEARAFIDEMEIKGKALAVDFCVELDRKYGDIEGGFEVRDFPELADAMFEIFLEFKKENAKISFDFELVE